MKKTLSAVGECFRIWFSQKTVQSQIDEYIQSQNPQSPGEVDHLITEYDRKQKSAFVDHYVRKEYVPYV
jgi:hypothetical protein